MNCALDSAGACGCPACKARADAHRADLLASGHVRVHVAAEGRRAARTIILPAAMADAYVTAGGPAYSLVPQSHAC